MSSLQTIIVALVAILLLFQTLVLIWIFLQLVRIRKPLEELIANARDVAGIVRRRAERLDVTLAQITQILPEPRGTGRRRRSGIPG
jgi:hypothetical protein